MEISALTHRAERFTASMLQFFLIVYDFIGVTFLKSRHLRLIGVIFCRKKSFLKTSAFHF
jgi:hypothetical protein